MRYIFDDFEVNFEQRQLLHADTQVAVEPKILDVLVFLIRNRDRVVSRDQLLAACWTNVYVGDNALSRYLSRVRQALNQPCGASRPIQTRHIRGYRFVAEVVHIEEARAPTRDTADAALEPESAELVEPRFMSFVSIVSRFDDPLPRGRSR